MAGFGQTTEAQKMIVKEEVVEPVKKVVNGNKARRLDATSG